MFPTMVSGYNEQNNAIIKNKGSIEALTKAYKNNQDAYYANIRSKSSELFNNFKTNTEDDNEKLTSISDLLNNKISKRYSKGLISNYGILKGAFGNALDDDTLEQLYKELNDKFKKNATLFSGASYQKIDFSQITPELQQKIRDAYSSLNQTIDIESEKVRPILQAYLNGQSSGYNQLDNKAKEAVQSFVQNIDSSFIEGFKTDTDVEKWITENVINPLKDGINKDDLAVRVQTLFSLDEKDYNSYSAYVKAVLDIINALAEETDKNGKKIYNKLQIENMKTKLGVSDVDSDGNVSGNKRISLTKDKFKNVEGSDKFIDSLNKEELEVLYKLEPDKANSVSDMKNFISKELQPEADKASKETKLSFSEAWEGLKNTNESSLKSVSDKLLELAKSGRLTKATLKELGAEDYFKNLGISADKAVAKINKLTDSATQLSSMSTQISKMSDMLADKANGKIAEADALAGFDVSVRGLDSWDKFEEVMGSSSSTMEQCQKAANALATEWVNNGNFLANLTEKNKDYYTTQLSAMGVENAEAVVTQKLADKKVVLALKEQALNITKDGVTKKTTGEITKLLEEANASDTVRKYLFQLVSAEQVFNNTNLDVDGKISKLGELASAYTLNDDGTVTRNETIIK